MDANREDYEAILALCKQDLCDDICITAMYVEKVGPFIISQQSSYFVCYQLLTNWFYPEVSQVHNPSLPQLVSDLYRAHASCQSVGRKLFYHVTDNLSTSVWRYPPSQQIFAFSIDCLGQYFIRWLNRMISNCESLIIFLLFYRSLDLFPKSISSGQPQKRLWSCWLRSYYITTLLQY